VLADCVVGGGTLVVLMGVGRLGRTPVCSVTAAWRRRRRRPLSNGSSTASTADRGPRRSVERHGDRTGVGTTGDWPLDRLLTDVVGPGPRSADDMSYEQARVAFARILGGEPEPEALSAFWMADRWKRVTATELAKFVDSIRDRSVAVARPDADALDCVANYDSKTDTPLLGVASGLVAAAARTPVVVHSASRVRASEGVAYRHVLDELGSRRTARPARAPRRSTR